MIPPGLRRQLAAARARVPLPAALGLGAWVAGVVARFSYIFHAHHPRHHVGSDAMPITALAEQLADPAGQQQFFHTIWPPGASAFYALASLLDPTYGLAALGHWLLSSLAPLFIGHAAFLVHGARAGFIALALASLHFGFVHYGGFFLAEQLFQAAVAGAVWVTVAALLAEGRRARLLGGVASGAAWILAFSFRPNALPVALFAAACLAARWLRGKQRSRLLGLAAGTVAALLLLAPLAHRCTVLLGSFCPGASNFAMNIALGHAPPGVAGLHFVPQSDHHASGPNHWFPPARLHHGYQGVAEVPASLYDTGPVLAWVMGRMRQAPAEFAIDSLGNALDLFGTAYWPDDYGGLPARRATVLKQLFFLAVLVPGLAFFGLQLIRLLQRRETRDVDLFLAALLVGMFLLAALSLGEARYRIPFDAALILFAAQGWSRLIPGTRASHAPSPAALTAAAVVLPITVLVLAATAHPQLRLAARLAPVIGLHRGGTPAVAGTLSPAGLGPPREQGSAWNAENNFVFECRRACSELRLELGGIQHAPRIEASTDHNDRYELVFYREGRPVGRVAWGVFEGAEGLRVVKRDVPASARTAGFDTLGLRPLYGDSRYSVGHVRLLDD